MWERSNAGLRRPAEGDVLGRQLGCEAAPRHTQQPVWRRSLFAAVWRRITTRCEPRSGRGYFLVLGYVSARGWTPPFSRRSRRTRDTVESSHGRGPRTWDFSRGNGHPALLYRIVKQPAFPASAWCLPEGAIFRCAENFHNSKYLKISSRAAAKFPGEPHRFPRGANIRQTFRIMPYITAIARKLFQASWVAARA